MPNAQVKFGKYGAVILGILLLCLLVVLTIVNEIRAAMITTGLAKDAGTIHLQQEDHNIRISRLERQMEDRANIPDSVYQARTEITKLMIQRAKDNRPFTKAETDRIDALWRQAQFDTQK
jgi:hypothetical protein